MVVGIGLAIAGASCFDWSALSAKAEDGGVVALSLQGGCAALPDGGAISLSNTPFTVSFWMVASATTSGPIVWQGGTVVGEAGWSFSVQKGSTLSFCITNESSNNPRCVEAPITAGDAIHVAVTSAPGTVDFTRSMNLYTLDWTKGETSHTVTSANDAVNTWSTSATFTLGGAFADGGCGRTSSVTLGSLRVSSGVLALSTIDMINDDAGCGSFTADYLLDDGSDASARDCSGHEPALVLMQPFTWAADAP